MHHPIKSLFATYIFDSGSPVKHLSIDLLVTILREVSFYHIVYHMRNLYSYRTYISFSSYLYHTIKETE